MDKEKKIDPVEMLFKERTPEYRIEGLGVHCSDPLMTVIGGDGINNTPMAIAMLEHNIILVNKKLEAFGMDALKAVCLHEVGHLKSDHKGTGWKLKQTGTGTFETQKDKDEHILQEIEADEYAVTAGYGTELKKFLYVLVDCTIENGDTRGLEELMQRIAAIQIAIEKEEKSD